MRLVELINQAMMEYLSSLQAAEAVARLGSMRGAADELHVTPGAISQQISKLEAHLGRKLFARQSRGLVLTEMGARMAVHLSLGFQEIRRGLALARERDDNVISISVAPVFAGRWLVWRLHRFSGACAGARVQIEATVDIVDPTVADIDACIRMGRGAWPGVRATHLVEHRVFPVCAPELAKRIHQPADLARVPIIRDTRSMFDWDTWLGPNDMSKTALGDGPLYSDSSIGLDAAIAGQGVLLAWETLAVDAISSGRLVAPLPGRFKTGLSYWFVEPEGTRRRPVVEAFHKWLAKELSDFST